LSEDELLVDKVHAIDQRRHYTDTVMTEEAREDRSLQHPDAQPVPHFATWEAFSHWL
jgi:heme exporter protein D